MSNSQSCISETRQGWRADSRTLKIQPLDMADDGDMSPLRYPDDREVRYDEQVLAYEDYMASCKTRHMAWCTTKVKDWLAGLTPANFGDPVSLEKNAVDDVAGCIEKGQSGAFDMKEIEGELRNAEDKKASPVHYEGGSMNDAEQERDPGCQKIKEDRA